MLLSEIQTKINRHHVKNQGAGARGQRGEQGLVGILTLSCGGGTGSPQSATLYLLAHKPLKATVTVWADGSCYYSSVSVYSAYT